MDGGGNFAIPGLWDMHFHTSSDRITREVVFPMAILHGVTGVRIMAADCGPTCPAYGSPIEVTSAWRDDIRSGTLLGPRLLLASYYINSPKDGEKSDSWHPRTAEEGRQLAHFLKERGVDFAKVYSGMSPESFFAFAEEANRVGLPFAGHVPLGVSPRDFIAAGAKSVEHSMTSHLLIACSPRETELLERIVEDEKALEEKAVPDILGAFREALKTLDPNRCDTLASTFKKFGASWTPTLATMEPDANAHSSFRSNWYWHFLPRLEKQFWIDFNEEGTSIFPPEQMPVFRAYIHWLVARFHSEAVSILAGSDAGTAGVFWGDGLHWELETLVKAGLTPLDALRSATIEPARFMGREEELGSIEPGKLADLVLLESNPLENISAVRGIRAVVARGNYLSRANLDSLRARAKPSVAAIDRDKPEPEQPQ